MAESISKHRLDLARELLDDIELSRLPPEQLLLKASRLARISEDIEAREWLNFELVGYVNSEKGRKYMDKMWRWTNKDLGYGHWMPFAALNGTIAAMQIQAQQLQVPMCNFLYRAPTRTNLLLVWPGRTWAEYPDPQMQSLPG